MQFSQESGLRTPTDLIPSGFLCWVVVTFRGMKASGQTSGRYGDLELTVYEGQPLARKKFWDMVADPDDERNSEAWRQSGMASLTRMLESAGYAHHDNPESYVALNGYTCEQILAALDGKRIAVRVKIENGEEGYADKNKVGDYLTPNPKSSGYKNYMKLSVGDHGLTQQQAQPAKPAGAFGQAQPALQQPLPTAGGGHPGLPLGQQPLKPLGGGGFAQNGGSGPAPAGLTATSHSSGGGFNPNAKPAWLDKQQQQR